MYKTINKYDFAKEFKSWDTYKDKFTIEGLDALFAYFNSVEEDTGEDIELDVVAIACEYTEYDSVDAVIAEYANDKITSVEDLEEHTTVIPVGDTGRVIIANF